MTPSDLIQAIELGYDIVKFFPAQQAGGVEMLKAFYGPFPNLRFVLQVELQPSQLQIS